MQLVTASQNATLHLLPFVQLAREAGGNTEAALRAAGLTEQRLRDPATRITFEQTQALLQRLVAMAGRGDVGLRAAHRYTPQDFDILGYLAALSADAWTALQTVARYSRLLCDSTRYDLETRAGEARIGVYAGGGRTLLPEANDALAASVHHMLCTLTGRRLVPLNVELARPRPRAAAAYHDYFGTVVRFEAAHNCVSYREEELRVPLATRDARLKALLCKQADTMVAALPCPQTILEQVRGEIRRQLEEDRLGIRATARALALSERTLRRRLHEAGRTYRALCEDVRREWALVLLRGGKYNVTEVAHLVGFSDATAFARAVRRWTGTHPRDYARQARAAC